MLCALVLATSCTDGDEPADRRLVERPTTTVAGLDGDAGEFPAPLPGTPPEEIREALDAALDERDTCALVAVIGRSIPDVDDPDAVLEAYRSLLTAWRTAREFRPEELTEAWDQVLAGVEEGVEALAEVGGDLGDPGVGAVFSAESLQGPVRTVQRWAELNCGSGPPEVPGVDGA